MLDIAIIGAGPAGLSAGINAVQRNKSVTVFGKNINTSFLYRAESVDNYLGMPKQSGMEMMTNFYNHAKEKGVAFQESRVLQVFPMDGYFTVNADNEFIEAKTVIIATGINKSKAVKGEEEYIGRGVSYCATCDGMLYRQKVAAVIGESSEAEEDANFLSELCSRVYYIPQYKEIGKLNDSIEIIRGKVTEVTGEQFVNGIVVDGQKISCDGAFFIKETTPVNNIVFGLVMDGNSIAVNRFMETNLEGVYAAGDCTGKPYQVSKAVGEGLIAAQQAAARIDRMK